MRKIILSLIVSIVVLSFYSYFPGKVNASGSLSLMTSNNTVQQNAIGYISIRVDSGAEPINAVQVNINYPADKLAFYTLDTAGSSFEITAEKITGSSSVRLGLGTITPKTGDQYIGSVQFKAITGSGLALVTLASDSAVYRSNDNVNVISGMIGVTFNLTSTPVSVSSSNPVPVAPPKISAQANQVIIPNQDTIPPITNGLTGVYFNNANLTAQAMTRIDKGINFSFGSGKTPAPAIGPDTWSVRWTGQVAVPKTDKYTFYARSDDGIRVWVDNKLLINNWRDQGAREKSGSIKLTGGKRYNIKVEYYNKKSGSTAELRWSSKSIKKQIIPANYLFSR